MKHLYFLYFLLTFVCGVVTLSITTVLYHKTKERLLYWYLVFYTVFTLVVISNTFTFYVQTNLPTINPVLMLVFEYVRTTSIYLLIMAIPAFMHYLCDVSGATFKNRIFAAITLITFVGFNLFQFVITQEPLQRVGPYIDATIFMGMLVYTIAAGFSAYPRLQDATKKPLAQKYLWLFLVFFPGIFSDLYLADLVPIRIFPVLYGSLSVVFVRYFLAAYLHHAPQASADISLPPETTVSLTERCAQYNITEREQEIIAFLLQGYSNPQIAEALYISLSTVKAHLRNIYPKIGVKSRYELIVRFKDQTSSIPDIPENQ